MYCEMRRRRRRRVRLMAVAAAIAVCGSLSNVIPAEAASRSAENEPHWFGSVETRVETGGTVRSVAEGTTSDVGN